jgi:hypothetical protein
MPFVLILALFSFAPQGPRSEDASAVLAEVQALKSHVAALHVELQKRVAAVETLKREVETLGGEVGELRGRTLASVAGPFLSGPPPSSDAVGVAKVAVFAPRLEIDAQRRHDLVSLKVRRVEPEAVRVIGELEFLSDQAGVDLPVDQNGALYLVEWVTSEGHNFALSLRDGVSGQTAAVVQVKPLQTRGRFIYVGYRIE